MPTAADVVARTINTYDTFRNLLTTKEVRDAATLVGPTLEFDYNDTVNGVVGLNAVRITRRGDKNGDGTIDGTELDTATLAYDALGRATTGLRADWYEWLAPLANVFTRVGITSEPLRRVKRHFLRR